MSFQAFEATTRPENGPPRLEKLRAAIAEAGLDGVLVPRADAYRGEYVAPADDVLAWLTGFTGSAGFAAVTAERAGVFIDGRYRVQVRAQVDLDHFTPVHWPETKLADWLKEALPEGGILGFDPWLHTRDEILALTKALDGSGIDIRPSGSGLIGAVWADRPAPPEGPVTAFPVEIAGETHAQKRERIAALLSEAGEDAAVLTLPDSISWLLNIRGADIPRIPVVHAFALLHADGRVTLYRRGGRGAAEIEALLGDGVTVLPDAQFEPDLRALSGTVRCDPKTAPYEVAEALLDGPATPVWADDPCLLPKARKSPAEIAATAEAHLRDGAAVAEFLAWLDTEAPKGGLTEIDVAEKLEACRRATGALKDISFDTISGTGPHGAIVHYRVTRETNRKVAPGDLLLVDSGGQYIDGTTDITRTIAVGTPGAEEVAAFTRVLQGMIAISRARWPRGLAGRDLDALARAPLWMAGQDYDHGTGHGVGVFLSVHEGPQSLSRRSTVPLEPGMIVSNEPGYYREGAFGIRIENLVVVEEAQPLDGGDGRDQLAFRTLTFAPIDRRLIDTTALAPGERAWLDAYHAEVNRLISPRITDSTRLWLEAQTRPL